MQAETYTQRVTTQFQPMGTLRRSKQRTDAFLLARPAGSLSNFKESSKRAFTCAQSLWPSYVQLLYKTKTVQD